MTIGLDPLLQDALEGLSEGVALFDADARLRIANRSFCDMNAPLRELLVPGGSWDVILREADKRGVYPSDVCKSLLIIESDLLTDPKDVHHVKLAATENRIFVLRMNASSDGGFILTQTETEDPDRRANAEGEVEVLLSKVLEACPACLTMSRVGDGQIIYRSPAATALLGTAKSHFSHFAKRADRADFITALLPDARVDDMRVTGMRADGSEFPAGLSARLIEYRGEEVIVSNMEDLTSILAVQAELAQQRNQVFQAEKMIALGELLAGVAHELNNPLSIIVGNSEMLKEDLENTEHARRIDKLSAAAGRCVSIVRSFLSMARQEPLDPKPTSASRILLSAREAVAKLMEDAGVELVVDLPNSLPDLMVDEVQIEQVAVNLLTNGTHAIHDSGIGGKISVTGHTDPASGMVCLSVADNGPGIDQKIANRIFDPLFTTKDIGKGTGVGLAYCQRVVVAHGGSIRLIRSKPPGAHFQLLLPAT